jgi:hypothetical protein
MGSHAQNAILFVFYKDCVVQLSSKELSNSAYLHKNCEVRFQVLTGTRMKMTVFYDVMP